MMETISPFGQPEKGAAGSRKFNREWIIHLLAQEKFMTRGQLSKATGLTAAAVSRITRELIETGAVKEGEDIAVDGRVGRRQVPLSINPVGAYVLGLSITANRRGICIANAVGEKLHTVSCEDIPLKDARAFLETMADRAKDLINESNFIRGRLLGVGVTIAISAGIKHHHGSANITADTLGWSDVPVGRILTNRLGLPVWIEHYARAVLRGEMRSQPPQTDVLLANVAFGIGTSAFLSGRYTNVGNPGCGSLSHLSIPGINVLCYCGRLGCLEAIASGKAVMQSLDVSDAPGPEMFGRLNAAIKDANRGDAHTKAAFREAGEYLGLGLDAALALLVPDRVIISGEVGRQEDFYAGIVSSLEKCGVEDISTLLIRSSINEDDAAIRSALQYFLESDSKLRL